MSGGAKVLHSGRLMFGNRGGVAILIGGFLLAALLSACEATPETSAETDAPPPEQAALPEVEVDDDPERLIGLGPNGLNVLLGQPELIRREPPARIWQYRSGECVFDVVLYEEAGGEKVTYVEARDSLGNRTAPRPCLNALLRARLTGASG